MAPDVQSPDVDWLKVLEHDENMDLHKLVQEIEGYGANYSMDNMLGKFFKYTENMKRVLKLVLPLEGINYPEAPPEYMDQDLIHFINAGFKSGSAVCEARLKVNLCLRFIQNFAHMKAEQRQTNTLLQNILHRLKAMEQGQNNNSINQFNNLNTASSRTHVHHSHHPHKYAHTQNISSTLHPRPRSHNSSTSSSNNSYNLSHDLLAAGLQPFSTTTTTSTSTRPTTPRGNNLSSLLPSLDDEDEGEDDIDDDSSNNQHHQEEYLEDLNEVPGPGSCVIVQQYSTKGRDQGKALARFRCAGEIGVKYGPYSTHASVRTALTCLTHGGKHLCNRCLVQHRINHP